MKKEKKYRDNVCLARGDGGMVKRHNYPSMCMPHDQLNDQTNWKTGQGTKPDMGHNHRDWIH